jgi:hypothetical protein
MSDQHDSTPQADDWQADWEGNRRQQLLQTLRATPGQRLQWLEEMSSPTAPERCRSEATAHGNSVDLAGYKFAHAASSSGVFRSLANADSLGSKPSHRSSSDLRRKKRAKSEVCSRARRPRGKSATTGNGSRSESERAVRRATDPKIANARSL